MKQTFKKPSNQMEKKVIFQDLQNPVEFRTQVKTRGPVALRYFSYTVTADKFKGDFSGLKKKTF